MKKIYLKNASVLLIIFLSIAFFLALLDGMFDWFTMSSISNIWIFVFVFIFSDIRVEEIK